MSATIGHQPARRDTGIPRRSGGGAPKARRRIPLPPLLALAGVAAVGLLALMPTQPDDGARPITERTLQVITAADGTTSILAVPAGTLIDRIPGHGYSFVRGVFHSLETYRNLHRVNLAEPYQLAELTDGRLLLTDPSTSTNIELEGFGSSNASKFGAFLGLPPLQAPR